MSKLTYQLMPVFVAAIIVLAGCAPAGSRRYRKSCLGDEPAGVGIRFEGCRYSADIDVLQRPGARRHRSKTDPACGGVRLNTGWLGAGDTVAVLLHQTDGDGMCGFLFCGEYLTEHGVRVVLMDFCDYGQSDCGDAPPQLPAQVEAVARAVRDQGAKRIVLVGASLGGSVAVAAAKRTKADAIVDLSGPADFGTLSITDNARSITMPALFAYSNTDRSDLDKVRQNLKRMPSKKKIFLSFPAGHGYELLQDQNNGELSPLADRVQRVVANES